MSKLLSERVSDPGSDSGSGPAALHRARGLTHKPSPNLAMNLTNERASFSGCVLANQSVSELSTQCPLKLRE